MSKTRTTVYIEDDLLKKYDTYKLNLLKNDKISFSELVNKLLKSHLDDPFKWNDQELYAYAMNFDKENEYE